MRKILPFPLFFLLFLMCVPGFPFAQDPDGRETTELSVVPGRVRINAFYKGTDVMVLADLPLDCDGAVVTMRGDEEKVTLKRKGKVSIFWLNVDDVTVSDAPGIYILNSSDPLENICAMDLRHSLLLGYDALKQHASIYGKNALSGSEFSDFVKLKEHNGSYQQYSTARLNPSDGDGKGRTFKAVLHIPPVLPSGDYRIRLFYFKDLALLGESSAEFNVEIVGFPKYLHSLAFNHPAFYGVFACVIAMTIGMAMGFIFGSKGRRKR